MNFTEIKIYCSTMGTEAVGGILDFCGVSCFSVTDPSDLDFMMNNRDIPADYVDEDLSSKSGDEPFICVYLPQNEQGDGQRDGIIKGIDSLKAEFVDENIFGSLKYETKTVSDEDWQDGWRKYFRPMEIGDRFVVKPTWEEYQSNDKLILEIDPESSFGTGQHETTRLCLRELELHGLDNKTVLDMGTGSGILSVAALHLGAKFVLAVDIDQNSIVIAEKNIKLNGYETKPHRYSVLNGDILSDNRFSAAVFNRKYDYIIANIVADVIAEMLPMFKQALSDGGIAIFSGIIAPRSAFITERLIAAGFEILKIEIENDWVMITAAISSAIIN